MNSNANPFVVQFLYDWKQPYVREEGRVFVFEFPDEHVAEKWIDIAYVYANGIDMPICAERSKDGEVILGLEQSEDYTNLMEGIKIETDKMFAEEWRKIEKMKWRFKLNKELCDAVYDKRYDI